MRCSIGELSPGVLDPTATCDPTPQLVAQLPPTDFVTPYIQQSPVYHEPTTLDDQFYSSHLILPLCFSLNLLATPPAASPGPSLDRHRHSNRTHRNTRRVALPSPGPSPTTSTSITAESLAATAHLSCRSQRDALPTPSSLNEGPRGVAPTATDDHAGGRQDSTIHLPWPFPTQQI